ncbi:MAG: hypothetical protein V3U71_12275 [Cocleimonas sp.]
MPKSTLFLVGFWADYEEYFFSKVQLKTHHIFVFNPKKIILKKRMLRWLPRPFRNLLCRKLIMDKIKEYPDSIFVFQDNRLFLKILLEKKPTLKGGIFMRNIVNKNTKIFPFIRSLQIAGYTFWSFDKHDCERYNFTYYHQFISEVLFKQETKKEIDFIFIGQDKGRKDFLSQLFKVANKLAYKTLIDIKTPNKNRGSTNQTISYIDYLKDQRKAKCIIDIVQSNQRGMTLRPLEALIYKQKLLSNNLYLKSSKIYHSANIFIIEDEHSIDVDSLQNFMTTPMVEIDSNIIKKYRTKSILKQLINDI